MHALTFFCCGLFLFFANPVLAKEFTDGAQGREALRTQVRQMFQERKFTELDEMEKEYRAKQVRFGDGAWKLDGFIRAFSLGTRTPAYVFGNWISLAEDWRRARPGSIAARAVLAQAWKDYSWHARGDGYASEVKESAWPLVRERLNKAWTIINEPLESEASDSPIRHSLRLQIGTLIGLERNEYDRVVQDALSQSPGYYPLYGEIAFYLLPKWHGEDGEWQRFLSDVYERNPQGEGATIYARIAWSLYTVRSWKDFDSSGASWAKMKSGFTEIDRNYPDSPWILNSFARFACRAGDRTTFLSLMERIDKGLYYAEAWDNDRLDDCRRLMSTTPEAEMEKMKARHKMLEEAVQKELLQKEKK